MKLYHYSFSESILSEGLDACEKHPDTKIINSLIFKRHEDCIDRDYCVFLNFDFRNIGDLVVSVKSEDLNEDLLYVANQDIANQIYSEWYRANNTDSLVDEYVQSIKPFSEYKHEYANAEVMYLGDISPVLLTIESED